MDEMVFNNGIYLRWNILICVCVLCHSVMSNFWDPVNCSPLGSSVHRILQARILQAILEWAAIPFSRGSSWPRNWTCISCIAGRFFTIWATREDLIFFFCGGGGEDASLVAQMVRNLPAMQETWVWSLGQEDPLEKGMATHTNILAWKTPWTEEPGGLKCRRSQRVGHDWETNTFTF